MMKLLKRRKIKLDFGHISEEYKAWRKLHAEREAENPEEYDIDNVKGFKIGSSMLFKDRYCDHINQMNQIFKENTLMEMCGEEENE